MRIDVDRMVRETQSITVRGLDVLLNERGVPISERTLYRWQAGGSLSIPKLNAVAEALGMELRDIVILDGVEGQASEHGLPPVFIDVTDYPALIKELDKRWTPEQWENFIRNTEHLIPEETPAAEWARCSEISDEDIDLLPEMIADDEQKALLKGRKDELSHDILEYLMENHFTGAFRTVVQDMLDHDIFESMMEEVSEDEE